MCFGWLDAQAFALSGKALADGWLSPGEASEGAAEVAAVTAGLRLQAARLAHQQEQADYERRLAADHQQQRRVLKEAAVAALAAGTLPDTSPGTGSSMEPQITGSSAACSKRPPPQTSPPARFPVWAAAVSTQYPEAAAAAVSEIALAAPAAVTISVHLQLSIYLQGASI